MRQALPGTSICETCATIKECQLHGKDQYYRYLSTIMGAIQNKFGDRLGVFVTVYTIMSNILRIPADVLLVDRVRS